VAATKDLKRVAARLDVQTLDSILADLLVPSDQWDLVLIGDGSGTTADNSCGWASVMVSRLPVPGYRRSFFGYQDTGGILYAELQAYRHAIEWHWRHKGQELMRAGLRVSPRYTIRTHLLCDNQTAVLQGKREYKREAEIFQWRFFDQAEELGYQLNWHWRPRNHVQLNRLCDALAGSARGLAELQRAKELSGDANSRLYTLNPTENECTSLQSPDTTG
jgi:hypothetical protein